jgi:hypothetical protein
LTRSEPLVAQCPVTIDVIFGARPLSHCGGEVSHRLFEHCQTHAPGRIDIGKSGSPSSNICLSAGELRTIIAIVELEQQVASLDGLVIDDGNSLRPATLNDSVVTSPPT